MRSTSIVTKVEPYLISLGGLPLPTSPPTLYVATSLPTFLVPRSRLRLPSTISLLRLVMQTLLPIRFLWLSVVAMLLLRRFLSASLHSMLRMPVGILCAHSLFQSAIMYHCGKCTGALPSKEQQQHIQRVHASTSWLTGTHAYKWPYLLTCWGMQTPQMEIARMKQNTNTHQAWGSSCLIT